VAKRVAYCGMLTALAMVFSYIEVLIPFHFGVPGIKLGLANLVVLTGIYYMRPLEVLVISVMRILLVGFMFGNGMSILYSLAGGLLSLGVMLLLSKIQAFSKVGVSIAGGVTHNIGQLLVAMLVVRTTHLVYYLPVLIFAGVVTGFLIGIVSDRMTAVWKQAPRG